MKCQTKGCSSEAVTVTTSTVLIPDLTDRPTTTLLHLCKGCQEEYMALLDQLVGKLQS